MDDFYRTPILQVRDPRAISDRSDVEALKNFFDTSPPPDIETNRRHVSASLSKSTDSRKQGKKKFFSLGKKRLSASDLEVEPHSYDGPKRSSIIPIGTTKRTVHGHTVIMIGSPVPPPVVVPGKQTPKLEITPPSPQIPSYLSSPSLQQSSVSFVNPVPPHMVPRPTDVLNTSSRGRNTRVSPYIGDDETPRPNFTRHQLVTSISETTARFHSLRELPSNSSDVSSQTQIPASSGWFYNISSHPPMNHGRFNQPRSTAMAASVDGDATPRQKTLPPSMPLFLALQSETVPEQRLESVKITMEKSVQTTSASRTSRSPGQKPANRKAIYENCSDMATAMPTTRAPPNMALPPTPPASSTSILMLQNEAPVAGIQSATFSKKRGKKNKVTAVPHSSPVPGLPNPDFIHLEIIDLEEMDDKERAFVQLSEMYKHQKFLREAEETFHRQKIADLTAGMMAQKMENLKLLQLLQRQGVTMPEIQSIISVSLDRPSLSRDTSVETLSRDEGPNLDPSRFAMLRKEEQFGQIQNFTSSIAAPEQDTDRAQELSSDVTAPLTLVKRARSSTLGPPLTPAPSMPLPPVPSTRRTTQSMVVLNSTPQTSPIPRSRSLTESNISSIPYLDSFAIDQNMRKLEREYKRSLGGRDSLSIGSIARSSAEDILQFYEPRGYEEFPVSSTTSTLRFSLTVEDVEGRIFLDPSTVDGIPAVDDPNNEPFTSPTLGSSICTFHSVESSNDVDVSTSSSSNSSPDPNMEGVAVIGAFPPDHGEPVGDVRSRRGVFPIVPSGDASAASPHPRPTNVDDSTWGALFMGLVRRSDTRPPTEVDMERGESGSISSIEV